MKKNYIVFFQILFTICLISTVYGSEKTLFKLEKGETALIVVDLQNEFVRDGGLNQVKTAKATLAVNKKLIDFSHKNNMPVIYTKVVNRNDNIRVRYTKILRPELFREKLLVPGHKRYFTDVKKELDVVDIVEEIYPEKGDYIIEKDLFDSFQGTNLDTLLRSLKIENVLVTGTVTHICVESTARGAYNHDYNPVLVTDAISSGATEAFIKETLVEFRKRWGRVMTSDEVMQELSQ